MPALGGKTVSLSFGGTVDVEEVVGEVEGGQLEG